MAISMSCQPKDSEGRERIISKVNFASITYCWDISSKIEIPVESDGGQVNRRANVVSVFASLPARDLQTENKLKLKAVCYAREHTY